MADDKDDKPQSPSLSNLVLVAKTPTVTADPVAVPVPIQPKPVRTERKSMSVRTFNTFTVLSACASGIFAGFLALILFGGMAGLLPLWSIEWAAVYWPVVCFAYVIIETVPLFLTLSMSETGFKIDKFTSWLPITIAVIAMIMFIVKPPVVYDLWMIAIVSFLTSIVDLMLMFAILRIRKKAEALIEEARRRQQPARPAQAA